jgi:hypothetical protein
MMNFLRKLRLKNIKGAKPALPAGRYFKYAIGEIILVVIGILIALSINNWNQGLKDSRKEAYFLEELEKEFINDSIQLQNLISLTENKAKEGKIIKQFLEGKEVQSDTIIALSFFNGRFLLFDSFTPTYDEIISTGQQSILKSDSLKTLIKAFKNNNSFYKEFLYDECKTIKKEYNLHIYKYFERGILPKLWQEKENRFNIDALGNFNTDLEGFRKDPESMYYVTMNKGVDMDLNRHYEDIVMQYITRILKKIRELKSLD